MKITFRTILLALYFVVYMLVGALIAWPWLIFRLFGWNRFPDFMMAKTVSIWGRTMLWVAGIKYKVYGQKNIPKHNRICFVSNHQGHFDGPLILAGANKVIGAISKIELKKFPLFAQWLLFTNSPFIDRNNREEAVQIIAKRLKDINLGRPMLIFPEGTRSKSNTLNAFKMGGITSVLKSGAVVVPITVNNTFKAFEANGNAIKPAENVSITFHEPIDTSLLDQENVDAFVEQLRKAMDPANLNHA